MNITNSNNVMIANRGTAGDSGTIRIGDSGRPRVGAQPRQFGLLAGGRCAQGAAARVL